MVNQPLLYERIPTFAAFTILAMILVIESKPYIAVPSDISWVRIEAVRLTEAFLYIANE